MAFKKLSGQVSIKSLQKGIWIVLLAFVCWVLLFLIFDQLFARIPRFSWQDADQIVSHPIAVAALLSTLLAFLAIPNLASFFRRWSAWRKVTTIDLFLFSFAAYCGTTGFSSSVWWTAPLIMIFALLALRIGIAWRTPPQPSARTTFDEVLGPSGLAPLVDFSQDELERGTFLEAILKLIEKRRVVSLTFGLEGSWGSGKTSLLMGLRKSLESKGYSVLSLSIWNYREPEKVLQAYFNNLERHLRNRLILPRLKRDFYKLAAGLADIAPGDIISKLNKLIPISSDVSIEDLREELDHALTQLDRPIVVLLDDLDRLDADELKVVLRAIRLVGDLPNLTHVIAYDREQLSKTLFPEDESGIRARDYLGKIINTEISIGSPPAELLAKLLDKSLGPLLRAVGDETAQQFVTDIQQYPLAQIFEALQTPREVRRVAAATAWIWDQLGKHLNLFDLFILTTIQYRFPKIYWTARAHPEWLTAVDWWTENPWAFYFREEWKKERKDYFESMKRRGTREDLTALILLKMLCPGIVEEHEIGHHLPSESTARKERRLLHPQIFNRYFHLYLSPGLITEIEIENFADQVRAADEGQARQTLVSNKIQEEARAQRIESLWLQWDLEFNPTEAEDYTLIRDLAVGIALASHALSTKHGFFKTSDRRAGIFKIVRLASAVSTDDEATALLEEVTLKATSIEVGAYLAQLARTDKTDSRNPFGERRPSTDRIDAVLNALISQSFKDGRQSLLAASKDELASIVLWASDRALVSALVLRDLERDPGLLPRLLELAAPEQLGDTENKILVEQFNPVRLEELVPVQEVHMASAKLSLSHWSSPDDRELVRRFREWIETKDPSKSLSPTATPPPPAAPPS